MLRSKMSSCTRVACSKCSRARGDAAALPEERKQQAVFPFGQGNRISRGIEQASAAALQPPAVKSVSAPLGITGVRGASHLVSPQNRADAGKQLPETERLGNVIVGTELEADDTVDFITAMPCGDDNRDIGMGAYCPAEVERYNPGRAEDPE